MLRVKANKYEVNATVTVTPLTDEEWAAEPRKEIMAGG